VTFDSYTRQVRVQHVLHLISVNKKLRLPCGDVRVATTLTSRGLVALVDPRNREFSTSYQLTPQGRLALIKPDNA